MTSNDEYQQQNWINSLASAEEKCDLLLKEIIDKNNLKEEFKKAFLNSVITGEYKVHFEI